MSKKRTKLEVIRDILEVVKKNKKTRITHIIYKANLSNNSIKPYLNELLGSDLLIETEEKGTRFFEITQKGRDFIDEFNKIKVFSDAYGLE